MLGRFAGPQNYGELVVFMKHTLEAGKAERRPLAWSASRWHWSLLQSVKEYEVPAYPSLNMSTNEHLISTVINEVLVALHAAVRDGDVRYATLPTSTLSLLHTATHTVVQTCMRTCR